MMLVADSWGSPAVEAAAKPRPSVHTDKFHRCVGHVTGSVENPYAICQASLGRNAILEPHRRRKRYYRTRHPGRTAP
jgi:hypothetical protein